MANHDNYVIQGNTLDAIASEVKTLADTSDKISPNEMSEKLAQANTDIETQADLIAQIQTALEGKAIESGGGGTEEFVGVKYSDFDSVRGNPKVADARSLPTNNNDSISGGYPYLFATNSKNPNGGWHSMVEDFYLPDGIQSLYSYMFYYCGAIKNIYGDLTSVGIIYMSCFQNSNLEKFDCYCPNLTQIQNNAFNGCAKLIALTLKGNAVVGLASIAALNSTPIKNGTGYIYVPKTLIEDYKVATNWTTYANQFRALEDYTVDGTITGALDESKI